MKHIYTNAAVVFVWLGPLVPYKSFILYFPETTRKDYELKDVSEHYVLQWYSAKTSTTIDSPQWQEIADLFCKPFFMRFWCIQESSSPKKIVAYDGRSGCNWNPFVFARRALLKGIHRHLRLRGRLKGDLAVVQRLLKLGDKVCILPSRKVPLLIRHVPDNEHANNHNH